MTNFEQALELEQNYIALRKNPNLKNSFNFKEKLLNLGFTLESFSEEKLNHFFDDKDITTQEIDETMLLFVIQDAIYNEKETILIVYNTQPTVYVPKNESLYNKEYCDINNIYTVPLGYNGGAIVTSNNDMGLVFLLKNSMDLTSYILNKINIFFHSKSINSVIVGNDLLINDYKIIGSATRTFEKIIAHYFQISFLTDNVLINNICNKDMIKIPKGLSEFNDITITRDEIKNEIKKWLL